MYYDNLLIFRAIEIHTVLTSQPKRAQFSWLTRKSASEQKMSLKLQINIARKKLRCRKKETAENLQFPLPVCDNLNAGQFPYFHVPPIRKNTHGVLTHAHSHTCSTSDLTVRMHRKSLMFEYIYTYREIKEKMPSDVNSPGNRN